jgi:hypothetical protein
VMTFLNKDISWTLEAFLHIQARYTDSATINRLRPVVT